MAGKSPNGDKSIVFDSCEDAAAGRYIFEVRPGEVVVLSAANVPAGEQVPIEQGVGPVIEDCWSPFAPPSGPVLLSDTLTTVAITAPGWYRLDLSGLTLPADPCVKIAQETLVGDDTCCVVSSFNPPAKPDSLSFVSVGVFSDTDPCFPLLARVECVAGVELTPYPIGYIDPTTGEFTMTDSGAFVADKPAEFPPITDNVYATFDLEGDPEHGRYVPLQSRIPHDPATNSYPASGLTYHDESNGYADVTAIVTGANWGIDEAPKRLQVGFERFQITSETQLPNIPATARYAEVYYNAQDGNVLWTVGDTVVTDNFSEDENGGVTVRIYGEDNIARYLGSSADGAGILDGAATRNASVTYSNMSPEEMGG